MNDERFDYEDQIIRGMRVPCLNGETHHKCMYCSTTDYMMAQQIIMKENKDREANNENKID